MFLVHVSFLSSVSVGRGKSGGKFVQKFRKNYYIEHNSTDAWKTQAKNVKIL